MVILNKEELKRLVRSWVIDPKFEYTKMQLELLEGIIEEIVDAIITAKTPIDMEFIEKQARCNLVFTLADKDSTTQTLERGLTSVLQIIKRLEEMGTNN